MGIFEDIVSAAPIASILNPAISPIAVGAAGAAKSGFDPMKQLFGNGADRVDWNGVPLPVLEKMNPELYKEVVAKNPELASAVTLGPSAMEGISTDPALRQAQMNALNKLRGIGDAGGRDAQFLADAARAQQDVNTNLQGNTQAIQQNMAMRGMSGGPTEAIQKQLAAQQGANRQAQMGLDLNAQAQQRALSALMGSADLGGKMQAAEFGQKSDIAKAKDFINQWNAQNQQNVGNTNVDIKNQFNTQQWQNQQDIANKNVGVGNAALQYNLNLPQQQFENQMQNATAEYTAKSAHEDRKSAKRKESIGLTGGLLTAGAQAYGG